VTSNSLFAQDSGNKYSSSSVLASGKWFKIAVTSDGIYKINHSKLAQLGLEYPSNPRIFCNNNGQLPYNNAEPVQDDLQEVAIFISGTDDILNDGEYLLFFGKGTHRWIYNNINGEYEYLRHNYSDTAFYFLTSDISAGERVSDDSGPAGDPDSFSSASDALFIYENENENLIKSGREWFQQISQITIDPGFTDLLTSKEIRYKIRVAARSSVPTFFNFYEGSSLRKSIQVPSVNLYNYTGTYAQIISDTGSFLPESANSGYGIRFSNSGETSAKGWLDYLQLKGRRLNSFSGNTIQYHDSKSVTPGGITGYLIKSLRNDAIIWDISNPLKARKIVYTRNGDNITFNANADSLKTFIAFTAENALPPIIKPAVLPNQNLHEPIPAEMIIVTHPSFITYAQKLAGIHLKNDGFISQVVTTEQVYNEFSGGVPDICAIRNFLKMRYNSTKNSTHPLKYLLLFGDGSYENKTLPPDNPNFIPTYQSQNSNVFVSSYTSDDFYGLLGDNDGEINIDGVMQLQDTLKLGVGRLPVTDTVEAGILISKIARYLDPSNMGDWKNIICLTADDEDGNVHMSDAEGLASVLEDSVPSLNIEKIYLDAFRQTTTVNGQSYPEVNKAISDRINSGCLIFNYVGHGNENGLAHERVIKTEDINSWKNQGKLPLFITATCEFSRFDDIEINVATKEMTAKSSGGEMVLLNKEGGGIALMSTTRVVYSAPNHFLNRNIFKAAFTRDESGNTMRLGDIIRIAKNNSGPGQNKRNFTLLGDPAIKLACPWHGLVVTDSINNYNITEDTDTIKALSLVTISGHIEDYRGNFMNDFSGVVSPVVFDKKSKITTLANDGGEIMTFNLRNNILFSGKTMAKDGRFRFTFIVPRDIDYSYGTGKISYYANDNQRDLYGNFSEVIVGGFSSNTLTDTEGPDIKLYLNDTLFKYGGITDNNPRLLAILEDKGGINTTGSGIGHDLTAYFDNDPNTSFVLNNYFQNDFDNYMKGSILYNLSDLSPGSHALTLKAWDNFNNSSEETILFMVESGGEFIIRNLINYPNPFLYETKISAEHNRPDDELNVTISIFNMNGRIIKKINTTMPSTGYKLPPVSWDGNSDGGQRVGRGIYPYSVTITTADGEKAVATGRMIIL
jgi:hypothetical protein